MVNVHLHGPLAKEFGKVWCLDIASPIEAIHAIAVTRPTIKNRVMEMHRKGLVFRVRSKHHDYDNDDVTMTLGDIARIDIIPIVKGAGPFVRAVLGAVLVTAGFLIAPLNPVLGSALVTMGGSLILGAVTEWLTPTPKQSSFKSLQSWTLGGPSNTVDQGLPVPVIYGEVLTGGYAISGGIVASDVSANGNTDPSASIGGDPRPIFYTAGPGTFTFVVRYSVGSFNISEPLHYNWSYTGLTGPTALRFLNSTTATVTIEFDVTLAAGLKPSFSGTLSVGVSGKKNNGSGDSVTVNTSVEVIITVDSSYPMTFTDTVG